MSYGLSVPLNLQALDIYGIEPVITQLKKLKADRVFLCPPDNAELWNDFDELLEPLRRNAAIMKREGFEVGVWVWAFQYRNGNYTYIRSPLGKDSVSSVCPTDKEYRKFMGDFVEAAAKCGIDLFMFDDDFRFTFIDNGMGCCCDNHLKMIEKETGEKVTVGQMEKYLLHGGKNKYRDAFLKANGDSLYEFSAEMRRRLDRVNPEIRMGFCSCIGSWDMDGIHPDKAAEILAGNTRPFYRLIGAPYWVKDRNWGNRLGDVIEFERIESSRRKNKNIEIFSECDAYPRPRFSTPAAFVEGFDTALRAAGCTDGILKYIFDYTAAPDYDTGYFRYHERNLPLYDKIDEMFAGKEAVGIRVYDKAEKYEGLEIPESMEGKLEIQNIAFNAGARMLTACSIPTVYGKSGVCSVAFGEDVKAVPDEALNEGLIIDLPAAEILDRKGIDTGLRGVGKSFTAGLEVFGDNENRVGLAGGVTAREITLDEKAVTESRFVSGSISAAGSYRYENANGQRFLVFCFDGYFSGDNVSRQYTRARQIIDAVPWLGGKGLPASIKGNPDLYMQTLEGKKSLAVGLWNFCPDDIDKPVITLDKAPVSLKTINCEAAADGKEITVSPLQPYAFSAVEAFFG